MKEFESLSTYINLAKKTINKFGTKDMLYNDDVVSDVANAIMIGDWRWDENRTGKTGQKKTKYSYRNQCAIWAIKTYLSKRYKNKSKKMLSLDSKMSNDCDIDFKEYLISNEIDPGDNLIKDEYYTNLSNDIQSILNSDIISTNQKEYIKLYFFKGYTLEQIGQTFNLTREAIRQNINKALISIKSVINNV